jgi:hypothetical protein
VKQRGHLEEQEVFGRVKINAYSGNILVDICSKPTDENVYLLAYCVYKTKYTQYKV